VKKHRQTETLLFFENYYGHGIKILSCFFKQKTTFYI
jgi:hypothetical protein